MNFFAHAIAERAVYELVALYARFPAKGFTDDQGFEVLAVADHFQMLTGQMFFDVALYVFWSNHGILLEAKQQKPLF
jgi:hypothetical protein